MDKPPTTGKTGTSAQVECISAVTLGTTDMAASLAFYLKLGFRLRYGGPDAEFTSLAAGEPCLNLIADNRRNFSWWGRVIFYTADVDAMYQRAVAAGLEPDAPPVDAEWGERYFHISDPQGHELSFAWPLQE